MPTNAPHPSGVAASPRGRLATAILAAAGTAALVAAGCSDPADIRPGDIRIYRIPKAADTGLPAIAAPRAAAASSDVRYDVPEGWSDRGASGMRLATLSIGDPIASHEVTVIPAAGTLESNVARWAGQLDPKADEAAREKAAAEAIASAERVDLDGTEATVVLLVGPSEEGDDAEAILGAMIPVEGGSSLFVKFKGPAAVASRERENFLRFVSSIRWR